MTSRIIDDLRGKIRDRAFTINPILAFGEQEYFMRWKTLLTLAWRSWTTLFHVCLPIDTLIIYSSYHSRFIIASEYAKEEHEASNRSSI